MPVFYVRSTDGANADDGSTWALAKATLAGAFAVASAGDTIYLSHVHAETQAINLDFTSPGTVNAICKVICVNDSTGALAETATISTTGASRINFNLGYTYYYGISFFCGDSSSIAAIGISAGIASMVNYFEECLLALSTTYSVGRINIGAIGSNSRAQGVYFKNSSVKFAHVSQGIVAVNNLIWEGGSVDSSGLGPNYLFYKNNTNGPNVILKGVDLSHVGGTLVDVNGDSAGDYKFSNCALHTSVTITANTLKNVAGNNVFIDQCKYGDPSSGPISEAYTYQGSVKTDTAIVRTGGASDGTAYSLKMTTNTTGVSFISPLITRPIPKAIDTVGSEVTVTAHIAMEEGATPLTESQCWMEVEYMGTSGSTLTSFATDKNSTVITESSTDQATSTETWTGFAGTPVKQKLSVAFTPQEKGFYLVRIYLARVSAATTAPPVYVCPKLVVS